MAMTHPTTERRAARTLPGDGEYPGTSLFNSPGGTDTSPGSLLVQAEAIKRQRDNAPRWAKSGHQRTLQATMTAALRRGE